MSAWAGVLWFVHVEYHALPIAASPWWTMRATFDGPAAEMTTQTWYSNN